MENKSGLSKKQQKKLKKLEKQRQVQEKEQQAKPLSQQQKPAQKPTPTKNKQAPQAQAHKPTPPISKPHTSSASQQQQQELPQDDGDIDFNQLHEEQNEIIDVTFLIAEIREEYYHSMKTVLLRYGQVVGLTESQIAGEVLEKGGLGNVVVAEDDSEEGEGGQEEEEEEEEENEQQQQNDQLNVYSVVTLLPPSSKITEKVKKQALNSLQRNKPHLQTHYNKLHPILTTAKSCTLLLSARLPNVPSFIICDSHQVFASDLQQQKKKNPKLPILQSEYILNVSEVEITGNKTTDLDQLIFSKYEDYEFCQKSVGWWVGENVKSQRQKADLRRLYFVIKLKDYYGAVSRIRTYLDEDNQQEK